MSHTKRVLIDALEPEMVVAEPVTDRSGRLLVGHGVVISDDHVRNMRAWGVSDVLVETSQQTSNDEPSVQSPAEFQARFALNDIDQPPFPTLLAVCTEQIEKGLTQ